MKTKIITVFFIINVLAAEGCAMNSNSEKNNTQNFEKSNFITEEKALMFAKQYLTPKGRKLYNFKRMRLIEKKDPDYALFTNEDFEKYWIIIIPTKFKVKVLQGLEWGIVYVDKKTGEVKPGGMGPS